MNVLMAADYIAPSGGAFFQSLVALARRVADDRGNVVFLFSEIRGYHDAIEPIGPVIYCPNTAGRRFSWPAFTLMLRACRRYRIDIIHVHFVGMAYLLAAVMAKMAYGCRIVIHWRNPPFSALPHARSIHRLSPLFYRMMNRFFIDVNVVISRSIGNVLIERRYGSARSIMVVNNAIDLARYDPAAKPDRVMIGNRFGGKIDGRPIVGMVANFSRQKDHASLMKALAIVKRSFPEVLLILVGSEKLREGAGYLMRARELAEELGLKKNIYFAGELDDVAEIISAFDVGVLASNFEGFGNAIVEYMAMGKPAIGTDVGGIRDIIQNGVTGFLVHPGDPALLAEKINFLLKNPVFRAEMGKKARIAAEDRFAMPVWVDRIMDIYDRLKTRRRKAA